MAETHHNYIAGDWVAGTDVIENRNPSDITDLIGHYTQASAAQADQALEAARRAQAEWAAYGLERKQNVLNAIGTEMMARAEELGTLLSKVQCAKLVPFMAVKCRLTTTLEILPIVIVV